MNSKSTLRNVFLFLITNIQFYFSGSCQNSSLQGFDEISRSLQLHSNLDSLLSFCVRPNYNSNFFYLDSFNKHTNQFTPANALKSSKGIFILPLILQQQYNTSHPYGWNDGSMIPAKGYQLQLSVGAYVKKGIFSLQLRPELVFAQNSSFQTFPSEQTDAIWKSYYDNVINIIDAPERFGSDRYLKIFSGQSSFRLNYHKLSLGISTENLWWGPGVRNSLLMSNNAPGFPHLTFNSLQPITSRIGSFEWQVIAGRLKGSGVLPDTNKMFNGQRLYVPKGDGERYINGFIVSWQPKWTKGLFIGFSRAFYQNLSDVRESFDGYFPVAGKLFKKRLMTEDEKKRDQMISFFFRFLLLKETAEVYGEFGRNDHSLDIRDAIAEPEHSRAYIIGFSKTFPTPKSELQIFSEISNLQLPSTLLLRAQESWYVHYQVRHGYTNHGQVIGAGIGPGASSQTVGLQWGSGFNKLGGSFERLVHNNDFYYSAFSSQQQWQKHWIDLSLNLNKSWTAKRIIYDARLSFIQSLNYQWFFSNVFNVSARIGVCYLF